MIFTIIGTSAATWIFASSPFATTGVAAPSFGAASLDGGKWTSLSQFVGDAAAPKRPVLLSFWSTTCVVCMTELPRVQQWAKQRPEVVFLPVLSEQVPPEKGLATLRKIGMESTGLRDPWATVAKAYGVCSDSAVCTMPSLVLIGTDRKILFSRQGYAPTEPLEASLDSALRH